MLIQNKDVTNTATLQSRRDVLGANGRDYYLIYSTVIAVFIEGKTRDLRSVHTAYRITEP